MIKSLSKNIIDVKTFGLAVKTVKSYGKTVWERVKPTPVDFGGFKFTALEAGEIGMTHNGTNATDTKPNLSYSKNGGSWTEWDYTNIPVVKDDVVYFKGINDRISRTTSNYSKFTSTGKIASSGNIMSLLYGDDYEGKVSLRGKSYCFYSLFYNCSSLTTAQELQLPATTLVEGCYQYMFERCSSLTTAPELPATTLANRCYYSMFESCSSLTTAPALPATTLAEYCYGSMFYFCYSLTTAPALPATTLAENCYSYMFNDCSSLTTAPELPATTLSNSCYNFMFNGCSSLTTAPALPATTLKTDCYKNMFSGCSSLVNAPELLATTLAYSCYSNMFSGCTSLTHAPELTATTLVTSCYSNMFSDCTQLNYIKALFTTTPSDTYTAYWVSNVSPTGTFVKSKDATWDGTGIQVIPYGWTVTTA